MYYSLGGLFSWIVNAPCYANAIVQFANINVRCPPSESVMVLPPRKEPLCTEQENKCFIWEVQKKYTVPENIYRFSFA